MSAVRWQDIAKGSIWREQLRGGERLIRVLEVAPPDGPTDRRKVSVKIRTVVKRVGLDRHIGYTAKAGSRESWTIADRFGRDFQPVGAVPA